jgi:NADH:ubiquinone oxidoreductase subunit 5 (subunit L)/multisubunit Na+/H+ antiporter MnhA subunit
MEGPTPVSALIHAATMVTAGIYLCIRLSFLFEFSSIALNIMILFGSFSALISGLMGIFQNDIKKIIAYSTSTQLGYMFLMCGLSQYDLALYHLMNHAFFKALLFLAGGVLIYIYKNQDLRKMSGLRIISSFLYTILLIGTLSSDGFFFFSSLDSKDVIIEISSYSLTIDSSISYIFGILSLFLTICYNSNLLNLCGGNIYSKIRIEKIDLRFIITLTALASLTLLSNYFLFQNFLNESFSDNTLTGILSTKKIDKELLPYYLKYLIVMLFSILNIDILKNINIKFTLKQLQHIIYSILGLIIFFLISYYVAAYTESLYLELITSIIFIIVSNFIFFVYFVCIILIPIKIRVIIDYYDIDNIISQLYYKLYYD